VSPTRRLVLGTIVLLLDGASGVAWGQITTASPVVEMEPVVVVSSRYPEGTLASTVFDSVSLDRETITGAPQDRLDDLLKMEVPGFSLFRRTSSDVANPTTQGPSLRNIGPNGAGRTLVLLDGVPQNDPFGGWVYWHRLPSALLGNISVVQGGGAGLFGNNALGGTVYLTRHQPGTLSASLTAGDHDAFEGTVISSLNAGPVRVSTTLHGQTTAGYPIVRADQRGPIDMQADSSSHLFESGVSATLDSGTEVVIRAAWFEEQRGNGTPYTGNHSEAFDLSLGIRGPKGDVQWETMLFYQGRRFQSTFSSVNEDRTAETPALDQYEVPAHSLGFSFTTTFAGGISLPHADKDESKLVTGVDARWIEGETRERFRFLDGGFLNHREAGGTQWLVGTFAEQTWKVSPELTVVLGGRADYWSIQDGSRRESVLATGAMLLEDEFPDRDGVVANGRLGIRYALTESVALKAAAYTGFRVPTLNELYRPFRVRNDITGANHALEPEQLVGVDLGFDWELHESLRVGVTSFWNRLNDAVANVTIQPGPGIAADGTVIPPGGVFRQRQNLDAVSTVGMEIQADWKPAEWLSLSTAYLLTHTEVSASSDDLDGNELAQAPAHVITGALTLQPHEKWLVLLQARYGAEQFEDDLNHLVLASYLVWDAAITYRLSADLSVSLVAENLFDREVETGRSGDGIVTIGAPRWVGVKVKWEF
jgi:outer membrane receptor protein involved in Fe transport